jgi:hypothetical protein
MLDERDAPAAASAFPGTDTHWAVEEPAGRGLLAT